MANHLAGETSPYLLQHQDNPVDWRPWGSAALAAALAANKPIMLSIGYAACHWCHVMAHESFEDPATAEVVNRLFVPIKIDREERPDLDAIYQQALALMGEHGGWPLTMFCTPAGEPFWGGTYFPPKAHYGRPAFTDVLAAVADAWTGQPERVAVNVDALRQGLAKLASTPGATTLSPALLDHGARQLLPAVDPRHGGLGGAPKFPQPGLFDSLWRAWLRTGDTLLRDAVTLTLDNICQGGITDHLGGGFARYATDDAWGVPHFEKMLYDNAQLIDLLTLAWQGTGSPLYRQRVFETVEWTLREMVAEGGAFAASLDADSEGEEGRFYTWDAEEIAALLSPPDAIRFARAYDLRPEGNWEGGSTILRRLTPLGDEDEEHFLADTRALLWRRREERVRPGRDDKILADWNGMMIAALANAAFVFTMPRWLDAARQAYTTVRNQMALPDHRLAHAMRFGRSSAVGLVDDLALMARAALVLFETTGDAAALADSRAWVAAADRHHWDDESGGYFHNQATATDLVARLKPVFDSAVPAANGVMVQVLARLGQLTGDSSYTARAEATLAAFSALAEDAIPQLSALLAGYEQLAAPVEITLTGSDGLESLLAEIAKVPLPTGVLKRQGGTGPATAMVCRDSTCSVPTADPSRLRDLLSGV